MTVEGPSEGISELKPFSDVLMSTVGTSLPLALRLIRGPTASTFENVRPPTERMYATFLISFTNFFESAEISMYNTNNSSLIKTATNLHWSYTYLAICKSPKSSFKVICISCLLKAKQTNQKSSFYFKILWFTNKNRSRKLNS